VSHDYFLCDFVDDDGQRLVLGQEPPIRAWAAQLYFLQWIDDQGRWNWKTPTPESLARREEVYCVSWASWIADDQSGEWFTVLDESGYEPPPCPVLYWGRLFVCGV
jgi:hypothetical protein